MWSLRWHFTNKSVTGAPYSIKSYSYRLAHSRTLWWRVRWLKHTAVSTGAGHLTTQGLQSWPVHTQTNRPRRANRPNLCYACDAAWDQTDENNIAISALGDTSRLVHSTQTELNWTALQCEQTRRNAYVLRTDRALTVLVSPKPTSTKCLAVTLTRMTNKRVDVCNWVDLFSSVQLMCRERGLTYSIDWQPL